MQRRYIFLHCADSFLLALEFSTLCDEADSELTKKAMHNLLWNGSLLESSELPIQKLQRAWNYGDGLFETIAVNLGKAIGLGLHLERLAKGAKVLQLAVDLQTIEKQLTHYLSTCLPSEGDSEHFMVLKLFVVRETGGRFLPSSYKSNWFCYLEESKGFQTRGMKACLVENTILHHHALSPFKRLGMTDYVLAALETKQKGAEIGLLSNVEGKLVETHSGNLIYKHKDVWQFPSKNSGRVHGIMEELLKEYLATLGFSVQERARNPEELKACSHLLHCNSLCLQPIYMLDGYEYAQEMPKELENFLKMLKLERFLKEQV